MQDLDVPTWTAEVEYAICITEEEKNFVKSQ